MYYITNQKYVDILDSYKLSENLECSTTCGNQKDCDYGLPACEALPYCEILCHDTQCLLKPCQDLQKKHGYNAYTKKLLYGSICPDSPLFKNSQSQTKSILTALRIHKEFSKGMSALQKEIPYEKTPIRLSTFSPSRLDSRMEISISEDPPSFPPYSEVKRMRLLDQDLEFQKNYPTTFQEDYISAFQESDIALFQENDLIKNKQENQLWFDYTKNEETHSCSMPTRKSTNSEKYSDTLPLKYNTNNTMTENASYSNAVRYHMSIHNIMGRYYARSKIPRLSLKFYNQPRNNTNQSFIYGSKKNH